MKMKHDDKLEDMCNFILLSKDDSFCAIILFSFTNKILLVKQKEY